MLKIPTKDIPAEIQEVMDYLSNIFSESIKDPVEGREDLYQDLIVVYLEKKEYEEKTAKDFWFTVFKNYLLDKYRRYKTNQKIMEQLKVQITIAETHYGIRPA